MHGATSDVLYIQPITLGISQLVDTSPTRGADQRGMRINDVLGCPSGVVATYEPQIDSHPFAEYFVHPSRKWESIGGGNVAQGHDGPYQCEAVVRSIVGTVKLKQALHNVVTMSLAALFSRAGWHHGLAFLQPCSQDTLAFCDKNDLIRITWPPKIATIFSERCWYVSGCFNTK